MLVWCAKSHHLFNAGAVVPGPVEEHDLALGGQMCDVALEVPLATFALSRNRQRRDARDARAEVFGDPLDRAAFARCITALEHDHDPCAGVPGPLLQLHEFRLQTEQFGFVDVVGDLVSPRLLWLGGFPRVVLAHCRIVLPGATVRPLTAPPAIRAATSGTRPRRSSRRGRR